MQARVRRIKEDKRLAVYDFHHLAIFEHGRPSGLAEQVDKLFDQNTKPGADRDRLLANIDELNRQMVYDDVKPLLFEMVENVRPDLILMHGGTMFTAVTGPILQTLIDVREAHGEIPVALEGRRKWIQSASQQANATQTLNTWDPFRQKTVRNQIKWVEDNCVEDEEVQLMFEAIF